MSQHTPAVTIERVPDDKPDYLYDSTDATTGPRPVYLMVDADRRTMSMESRDADAWTSGDVWDRRTWEIKLDSVPTARAANELMEHLLPAVGTFVGGVDIEWNGSDHKGMLNEDAEAAWADITGIVRQFDGVIVEGRLADDWFDDSDRPTVSATATDAELVELATELAAEHGELLDNGNYLVITDLDAYLKERREEMRQAVENLTITPVGGDADLYHRFPGQNEPQEAFIGLDLGSKTLFAAYDPHLGGGTDAEYAHRRTLAAPLPKPVSADAANTLMEELRPLAARVCFGSNVSRDNQGNLRGTLNSDAEEAWVELCGLVSDAGDNRGTELIVWVGDEWFSEGAPEEITAFTTDEELEAIEARELASAQEVAEQGQVVSFDRVDEYLAGVREERREEATEALREAAEAIEEATEARDKLMFRMSAFVGSRKLGTLTGMAHTSAQKIVTEQADRAPLTVDGVREWLAKYAPRLPQTNWSLVGEGEDGESQWLVIASPWRTQCGRCGQAMSPEAWQAEKLWVLNGDRIQNRDPQCCGRPWVVPARCVPLDGSRRPSRNMLKEAFTEVENDADTRDERAMVAAQDLFGRIAAAEKDRPDSQDSDALYDWERSHSIAANDDAVDEQTGGGLYFMEPGGRVAGMTYLDVPSAWVEEGGHWEPTWVDVHLGPNGEKYVARSWADEDFEATAG